MSETILPGYETVYITRPSLADDALDSIHKKVESVITEFGGQIVEKEDWGNRKLAYDIQKEPRGHYTYVAYTGKPGVVHEIERNFRINEHLLRFMTMNIAKEFSEEEFRENRQKQLEAFQAREERRRAARR